MLRSCDAEPYLRFRQNLADTDCNAVFSNGSILPVLIRNGGSELFVELTDYTFHDPEKLTGFARFERKPDAAPEVVETSIATKPKTYEELKQSVNEQARRAIAEQYANRREQQGMPVGDSVLAKASHELAQTVSRGRGQSGPNSKLR